MTELVRLGPILKFPKSTQQRITATVVVPLAEKNELPFIQWIEDKICLTDRLLTCNKYKMDISHKKE